MTKPCAPTVSSSSQLDIEFAQVDEAIVQDTVEQMMQDVFREVMDVELGAFPRMTWADAMPPLRLQNKPDLRIALELVDVDAQVRDSQFKVFTDAAGVDGMRVCALRIGGCGAEPQADRRVRRARREVQRQGPAYAKLGERTAR